MLYKLDGVCKALQATWLSGLISSIGWIIPFLQVIHILAISSVISSVFLLNLRLLGVWGGDEAPDAAARRLLPFIWWPLPVLLITGALLITAEPARSLENPTFAIKMLLLAGAIGLTILCQRQYGTARIAPVSHGWRSAAARGLGAASITLWVGIVLAGRWIAYTQP
jgi:uncharacterized membrane protein